MRLRLKRRRERKMQVGDFVKFAPRDPEKANDYLRRLDASVGRAQWLGSVTSIRDVEKGERVDDVTVIVTVRWLKGPSAAPNHLATHDERTLVVQVD